MFGLSTMAAPLFGVSALSSSSSTVLSLCAAASLALSSPDAWRRLVDRCMGVALQKEATKRKHWQDELGAPINTQFFVQDGRLHLGPDASYEVQLLGVEGMDAFLWAWALTEEMKASDPFLGQITPDLVCEALKDHDALLFPGQKEDFPEFTTPNPIPLSTTHSGQTFADIAAAVLGQDCRAVYQVPDYATGLVYYWLVTDDAYPLDDDTNASSISACARLSDVLQTMIHPHARHRIHNLRHALEGYADALGLTVIVNDDGSQFTATPRNVFWGDSLLIFCDPTENYKIMGLSGQYHGALHTTWVEYDEFGRFDKLDVQPSLDLATGLPIDHHDDNDDNDTVDGHKENKEIGTSNKKGTPAINGSSNLQ